MLISCLVLSCLVHIIEHLEARYKHEYTYTVRTTFGKVHAVKQGFKLQTFFASRLGSLKFVNKQHLW